MPSSPLDDGDMAQPRRKASGGVKRHSTISTLARSEWNPKFSTHRGDVKYAKENERYIEFRDWESEGVVLCFMRGLDESEACLPRVAKIEEYCFGASLEALKEKGAGTPLIAWLDQRCGEGKDEKARRFQGPLTAQDLYLQLMKPFYHEGGKKRSAAVPENDDPSDSDSDKETDLDTDSDKDTDLDTDSDTDSDSDSDLNCSKNDKQDPQNDDQKLEEDVEDIEPDAERTKMFFTDLDRWGIYALMATASEHQTPGLRDAIYKHLNFENFIGVTIPPSGFAMFQLAFHIPFYAWRTSQAPRDDHRLDANAERLRKSRDVSFMNWKSSGCSDFLYEAQYSCLLAGTDEWHWIAYGFFDTYFDAIDEAKETLEGYNDEGIGEEGMHVDPLTFGSADAHKGIVRAREYFLCVFRIRIAHVLREWEQVVAKVKESIREYRHTHILSLGISRDRSIPKANKEYDEMVRRSRDWVVHVKRLTRELLQHLSKTVDACEKFCDSHAVYFQNSSGKSSSDSALPAVHLIFDRLEYLKKDLEYSVESCEDFAQDLELHVILEGSQMSNVQNEIAKDNKRLALIMMLYISPVGLSAAILSMNSDVISFIPASFSSFIGLVFIFGIFGLLIHVVSCWQFVASSHGSVWTTNLSRHFGTKVISDGVEQPVP